MDTRVVSEYGSCGWKRTVGGKVHTCRFSAGHPGPHRCTDCSMTWAAQKVRGPMRKITDRYPSGGRGSHGGLMLVYVLECGHKVYGYESAAQRMRCHHCVGRV